MSSSSRDTLPTDLVEKIIAKIPYPSIFKARLLSKSWHRKFQPTSFIRSEDEESLVKYFHTLVSELSHTWDTFGPVYVTEVQARVEGSAGTLPNAPMIVYNKSIREWQKFPSLGFLPGDVLSRAWTNLAEPAFPENFRDCLFFQGAFFYGADCKIRGSTRKELHVGNTWTREWKTLPTRPNEDSTHIRCMKLAIHESSEIYKLVLVCETELDENRSTFCFAQIYDSKSESWTSNMILQPISSYREQISHAYLNGFLYMMAGNHFRRLLALNVENGTVEELRLWSNTNDVNGTVLKLLVCNGNLVMIVWNIELLVMQIDLVTLELFELARCPRELRLEVDNTHEMVKNGLRDVDCIFFSVNYFSTLMLQYNKRKDEWSFFHCNMDGYRWDEFSFQPAQNPFMAV